MTPIVFLDFDDVVVLDPHYTHYHVREAFATGDMDCPELWENIVDSGARANLRQLHDEFRPTYVISTSWTTFLTKEQLIEFFQRTGLAFVTENLHAQWATPKAPGQPRVEDIWRWCRANPPGGRPLLVLDDTESGWSLAGSAMDRAGQVVLCRAWVGFTAGRLAQAQEKLRAQMRPRGAGRK